MSESVVVAPEPADLAGLEALWPGDLREAFESYLELANGRVALAAAMVDTAARLQRLGGPAVAPGELLLGDLCLARASRLLADEGDMNLQVAFAQAVERVASLAAAERQPEPMRALLAAAIQGRR